MNIRKLTKISMLLSVSVVLSIIESAIPVINNIVPGMKLGLANSVIIFAIYMLSFKDALYISIMRIILVGILRTGLFNTYFIFSIVGAIMSIISMYISKKYTKLSVVGVSVIGAIFHSIGQTIIAILLLNNINVIYYIPYLFILSIPAGILVGISAKQVIEYYKNKEGENI